MLLVYNSCTYPSAKNIPAHKNSCKIIKKAGHTMQGMLQEVTYLFHKTSLGE